MLIYNVGVVGPAATEIGNESDSPAEKRDVLLHFWRCDIITAMAERKYQDSPL